MSKVKSTNELASIQTGFDSQWIHIDAGNTGVTTLTPRAGEIMVLLKVVINTAGSVSPITLTDTATGVIANIAAAATPGQLPYNIPCARNGNLTIRNAGGADFTLTYRSR